ncbi:MAG: acyltransferase family protein [Stenotrophomonas sp.]
MTKTIMFFSIQALRGVAALAVLLFHLRIVEGKYGEGPVLLPKAFAYADSGVDLFFVLSGFVMTSIATGTYGSPKNAGQFLLRRGWRVLPMYWFYTTLVVLLMLVMPGIANSAYQEQSIAASYLLWPQSQLPLLTVGWTLIHEAFFYLLMAVAIAFARERQLPWLLLGWAGVTLIAHAALGTDIAPWAAIASNPLSLEFIAGAFIGLYWRRLSSSFALPLLLTGIVLFAGAIWHLANDYPDHPLVLLRTLYYGGPAALLVLGAVRWEHARPLKLPSFLLTIGNSSYSLYLSHVFVISVLGRFWQASGFNETPWQHALFVALTVAACTITGWLSWRLLEQPLQRLTHTRKRSIRPLQTAQE